MRVSRTGPLASDTCSRCTAVLLRGASLCSLCGWPATATFAGTTPTVVDRRDSVDTADSTDPAGIDSVHGAHAAGPADESADELADAGSNAMADAGSNAKHRADVS